MMIPKQPLFLQKLTSQFESPDGKSVEDNDDNEEEEEGEGKGVPKVP